MMYVSQNLTSAHLYPSERAVEHAYVPMIDNINPNGIPVSKPFNQYIANPAPSLHFSSPPAVAASSIARKVAREVSQVPRPSKLDIAIQQNISNSAYSTPVSPSILFNAG